MKGTLLCAAIVALCSGIAAGQDIPRLTVKGHVIGESVKDFAAVVHFDLSSCPATLQLTEKEIKHRHLQDQRTDCQIFEAAEDGIASFAAGGEFGDDGKAARLVDLMGFRHPLKQGENWMDLINPYNRIFSHAWNGFVDQGQLVQFVVKLDPKYTFKTITEELTEKYGPPSTRSDVVVENGYGATATTEEAVWRLQTGLIVESEAIIAPSFGQGWQRTVTVVYSDHEHAKAAKLPPALE